MSDTSRLGINITATDNASASIRQLQQTVKGLEAGIVQMGQMAQHASAVTKASLETEIAARQREIAVIREQIVALGGLQAAVAGGSREAIAAAMAEAKYINENIDLVNKKMQAQLRARNAVSIQERNAVEDAARFEAEQLNATMIAREAAVRQRIAQSNARVYQERAAAEAGTRAEAEYINRDMDLAAAKQRAEAEYMNAGMTASAARQRAEADYANREVDLINAKARAEANYINQGMTASAAKARAEAEYANRNIDLISAKNRAEADYINQGMTASAAKARAEAEYHNRNLDLVAQRQRAEAEYINQGMTATAARARAEAEYINRNHDLAYTAMRREAELENAAFDRRKAMAARSAAGIIAADSPSKAAAAAAASATVRGLAPGAVDAAATEAATAALARQQGAIRAVAAAMQAAGRLGANAEEMQAAATRAATMALEQQAVAARVAATAAGGSMSGLGGLFQRESKHIVGLFDSLASGHRGQALSSLGAGARDAGMGVGLLAASMGALMVVMGTAAILHHVEALGKWATQARAAAGATGMSVHAYTQLQGALRQSGLAMSEADASLRHLATTLQTAIATPSSDVAQAFHNIGISQADLVKSGGDVNVILNLLAEAWVRTADGATKAANFEEIFGRGVEKILPLLQNGAAGLDRMRQKSDDLAITLNDKTAAAMEHTGEKATELSLKLAGQVNEAFLAWGGTIEKLIGLLTTLGDVAGKVIGIMSTLQGYVSTVTMAPIHFGQWLSEKGQDLGHRILKGAGLPDYTAPAPVVPPVPTPPAKPKVPVPPLIKGAEETVMGSIHEREAEAKLKAGEAAFAAHKTRQIIREEETRAEIAVLEKALATEVLTDKQRGELRRELFEKKVSLINQEAVGAHKGKNQELQDFIAAEKVKIAEAQGNSQKILAIYDEMLNGMRTKYHATAAQISNIERERVNEVNKARMSELKEQFKGEDEQVKLAKLNRELGLIQGGGAKISGQKTGYEGDLARQREDLQEAAQVEATAQRRMAAWNAVAQASEAGSDAQKKAQEEVMSILISSKEREIQLYRQAAEAGVAAANKLAAPFTKFFDKVGSEFETFGQSIAQSILAPQTQIVKRGLTSVKESMRGDEIRQAFTKLATSLGQNLANSVGEALSHTLANMLSKGAANTMGELLGQTMSKLLGSIVGQTAGAAAGQAAGGAAGQAAGSTAVVTAVETGAVTTVTGLTTATETGAASVVGAIGVSTTAITGAISAAAISTNALLAALNLKPSVLGTTYAGGGIVSAAGGYVGGMGTQLAVLHAREMVLPEPISMGIQKMIGQGGHSSSSNANLNYSPTINTSSKGRGGTGMSRSEFSQMMSMHGGAMLGEARNMMRGGWRPA